MKPKSRFWKAVNWVDDHIGLALAICIVFTIGLAGFAWWALNITGFLSVSFLEALGLAVMFTAGILGIIVTHIGSAEQDQEDLNQ